MFDYEDEVLNYLSFLAAHAREDISDVSDAILSLVDLKPLYLETLPYRLRTQAKRNLQDEIIQEFMGTREGKIFLESIGAYKDVINHKIYLGVRKDFIMPNTLESANNMQKILPNSDNDDDENILDE